MIVAEVLLPILTDWGLPIRKSRSQSQRVGFRPRADSVRAVTAGIIGLTGLSPPYIIQ